MTNINDIKEKVAKENGLSYWDVPVTLETRTKLWTEVCTRHGAAMREEGRKEHIEKNKAKWERLNKQFDEALEKEFPSPSPSSPPQPVMGKKGEWISIKRQPIATGNYLVLNPNSPFMDKREIARFSTSNYSWTQDSDTIHPSHWQKLPSQIISPPADIQEAATVEGLRKEHFLEVGYDAFSKMSDSEIEKHYTNWLEQRLLSKREGLPTDEEIRTMATKLYQTHSMSNQIHREAMEVDRQIFIDGAVWMRSIAEQKLIREGK